MECCCCFCFRFASPVPHNPQPWKDVRFTSVYFIAPAATGEGPHLKYPSGRSLATGSFVGGHNKFIPALHFGLVCRWAGCCSCVRVCVYVWQIRHTPPKSTIYKLASDISRNTNLRSCGVEMQYRFFSFVFTQTRCYMQVQYKNHTSRERWVERRTKAKIALTNDNLTVIDLRREWSENLRPNQCTIGRDKISVGRDGYWNTWVF